MTDKILPNKNLEIRTVKIGMDAFTVWAYDTGTCKSNINIFANKQERD